MDPLTGAAIAAAIAVASIAIAIRLPNRLLPVAKLRPVGGISLALLGLTALGVPIPSWIPTPVLIGGLAIIMLVSSIQQTDSPEDSSSQS